MTRAKAARRVAPPKVVTATLAAMLSPARAEASRRNGAKSKGPRTAEGKARSAQNALKHGLRAEKFVVVGDEDPREFAAHEAALLAELAPEGALQAMFAGRIVRAAWRIQRADQIEAELFAREMSSPFGGGDLGLALIRDGNGARAFDVLLRYRGAAQAELLRMLRTLKALQVEAAQETDQHTPERAQIAASPEPTLAALPSKPEARAIAGESRHAPVASRPDHAAPSATVPSHDAGVGPAAAAHAETPACRPCASPAMPIEPESLGNPRERAIEEPGASPASADRASLGMSGRSGTAGRPGSAPQFR